MKPLPAPALPFDSLDGVKDLPCKVEGCSPSWLNQHYCPFK